MRFAYQFLCVLIWATASPVCAASDLFSQLRAGNDKTVQDLIASDADVNAHDADGETPLMTAVLYANPASIDALIKAGANVNVKTKSGRTALLMATPWPEKVARLLKAGADPLLESNTGVTPLQSAARSSTETGLLLLKYGVKPDGKALRAAAESGRLALVQAFLQSGVLFSDVEKRQSIIASGYWGHLDVLRVLIAAGARVRAQEGDRAYPHTPLMSAAYQGNESVVNLLLEKGADPNEKGWHQYTALHFAAGAEGDRSACIKLLLAAMADPTAKDADSLTPLDWAKKSGHTAVIRTLGGEPSASKPAAQLLKDQQLPLRDALNKAVALLEKSGPISYQMTKCTTCHHQSLAQIATRRPQSGGVPVDTSVERQQADFAMEFMGRHKEGLLQGGPLFEGFIATAAYTLAGLAETNFPPNETTTATAAALVARQEVEGSFFMWDTRQPLAGDRMMLTALSLRGLQYYAPPGSLDFRNSIAKAKTYLEKAEATDTQSLIFQILGLHWAGSGNAQIHQLARKLEKLQFVNGGWSQRKELNADPYTTGQALWALHTGAKRDRSNPVLTKGAEFLRCTQLEDGSWHVETRAFQLQTRHETGFPHGRDQWISVAATAYAVIGLTPFLETTNDVADLRVSSSEDKGGQN